MKNTLTSLGKEVMNAHADCNIEDFEVAYKIRNLNFKASRFCSPAQAKKILERAKVYYNEFEPTLLDKFPADCEIAIAREGSVCLYVVAGVTKLPSRQEVSADEFHRMGGEVRYWWD